MAKPTIDRALGGRLGCYRRTLKQAAVPVVAVTQEIGPEAPGESMRKASGPS